MRCSRTPACMNSPRALLFANSLVIVAGGCRDAGGARDGGVSLMDWVESAAEQANVHLQVPSTRYSVPSLCGIGTSRLLHHFSHRVLQLFNAGTGDGGNGIER